MSSAAIFVWRFKGYRIELASKGSKSFLQELIHIAAENKNENDRVVFSESYKCKETPSLNLPSTVASMVK